MASASPLMHLLACLGLVRGLLYAEEIQKILRKFFETIPPVIY